MTKKMTYRKAFTVTEIVVASSIFIVIFFALSLLTTTSRTETSKSINYLRALELAQEAVDWVNAAPFDQVNDNNLELLRGSLVSASDNQSVKIPVGNNASSGGVQEPHYPNDYNRCYYYRTVEIEPLNGVPNNRFLKKIVIKIFWNEGKAPNQLEPASGEPDRMNKLILSTIIFNEKEYY